MVSLVLTATSFAPAGMTAARADDAPQPASQQPDAAPVQLEEVVVTTRKTAESLIDVPLSITAMTADALEAKGITDYSDIAAFTPGFRNQNQSVGRNDRGFQQFIIRGMVPNSASSTRQSVTIFVDGAPVSGGNIAGIDDVERVEVVRGPQSAMFGRSTFAGAINFITREPSFDWGGKTDVRYEEFGTTDITGALEGPIVADKVAFRLSARDYHTDGPYTDVNFPGDRLGERNTKSVSLALLVEPVDTVKIHMFGIGWQDHDGLPANGQFGPNQYNCNPSGGANSYICGQLGSYPRSSQTWDQYIEPTALARLQRGSTLFGSDFIDHLGLERNAGQARMIADWNPDNFTVSAITSWSQNKWGFLQTPFGQDTRSIPNPAYTVGSGFVPYNYSLVLGNTHDEDEYAELRIASRTDGPVSGLLGVNYLHQIYENLTTVFGNTGYFAATPDTLSRVNTEGVFGSFTWHFFDQLTLTGEARYQKDKQFQETFAGTDPQQEQTFDSFTPRAIIEYKPTLYSTVYVSYSQGNRPGEFNTAYYSQTPFVQSQISKLAQVQGVVPEDKIKMEELGYKGQLLNDRLRILTDIYYGVWTNRHVPNTINFYPTPAAEAAGTTGTLVVTSAGGKVDLKGFEFESEFRATSALTLEATFDVADTVIKNTACSDCLALTGNPNPIGNQLPYYPKLTGSLSGTYERPLGPFDGFVRLDGIYTGKMYDTESDLTYTANAATVNLHVGFRRDGYRAELYGTNLFNNTTATSLARTTYSVYAPTGTSVSKSAITVSPPQPLTIGIHLSKQF